MVSSQVPAADPDRSAPLREAVVSVPVATVWRTPIDPRPGIDEPALAAPSDLEAWTRAMPDADARLWLLGRADTQALLGTRVLLAPPQEDADHARPGWTRVLLPDQTGSDDPRGYPGWVPTRQLVTDPDVLARCADGPAVTVTAQVAVGRVEDTDTAGSLLPVSFLTRLPLAENPDPAAGPGAPSSDPTGEADPAGEARPTGEVRALLPGGGTLTLRADEVRIGPVPAATGADVLATARRFLGLRYLWAGTSGWGMDCSGLSGTIYRFHGVELPRDAGPQLLRSGMPRVERDDLQVGDLVFFSDGPAADVDTTDPDRIRHVALYAGDDTILHAPNSTRGIEEVRLSAYDTKDEYAGAIRPLAVGE
jgi:cell wall-associated NlpC family hydrolase